MIRTIAYGFCLAFLTVAAPFASAGDWAQFRGPAGTGVSDETNVPTEWGPEENVRWRTELPGPGNNGSPIVSGNRVFVVVATEKGRKRALYCLDRSSGELLWERTVEFSGDDPTHGTNQYGGTTPAADGQRVVVWHSSAGMYSYDYEGNLQWSKDLGEFKHIWGYGASPIIHGDLVLNNCGPGERTFLVALNKHTGEEVWRTDEAGGNSGIPPEGEQRAPWIGSWSTPMVVQIDGAEQVLVSYPHHVKGYDLKSGKVLWQCDGLGDLVYTSPVLGNGIAVSMGGFHGPAIGFKLGGSGNTTDSNRLWHNTERNPQRIGSGVILGEHLYMVNENGTVQCINPQTGEEHWRGRLPKGGRLWSSLVAAEGRLYVSSQQGDTTVFAVNPEKFESLAVNSLGEHTNSTIAVSNGQIFHRTYKAIYCIEAAP